MAWEIFLETTTFLSKVDCFEIFSNWNKMNKMVFEYRILLIISSEKGSHFLRVTLQPQKLFGECMHRNTMTAHKSW